jgi:tight adherence protein B
VAIVPTVAVGLIGSVAALLLVRAARRFAVADRLRPDSTARARRLPRAVRVPLARALADAALSTTPEQALQIWTLAAGVATVVGCGIAPVAGVIGGMTVFVGGPILLRTARHRRARAVAAALPDLLDRIGAELRAGGTVATGVAAVAHGDDPLAPDLARVETRVGLGASLPNALQEWARERSVPGVSAAAGALALTAAVGGRAADALEALASSLRDRLAVVAEARALSAQARYSAWVIGVAPLAYVVASAVIDRRSLHNLLGTAAGRMCAATGIGLEILGALWMKAIVRAGDTA